MRRERWLEAAGGRQYSVFYTSWFQNKKGAIMNDDDDYNMIDEIMHWVTIIFLVLMTITFLAGIAGFVWGMT
jgi:hypothetical protein